MPIAFFHKHIHVYVFHISYSVKFINKLSYILSWGENMEKAEKQKVEKVEAFAFFNMRVPLSFLKKVKLYQAQYFEAYGKKLSTSDLTIKAIEEYIQNHPIEVDKNEQ